jgi:hypothetical protein
VSFGPKLDALPVVSPGGQVTATLIFEPADGDFEQKATIYVEESAGIRLLKIKAKSATPEPTS